MGGSMVFAWFPVGRRDDRGTGVRGSRWEDVLCAAAGVVVSSHALKDLTTATTVVRTETTGEPAPAPSGSWAGLPQPLRGVLGLRAAVLDRAAEPYQATLDGNEQYENVDAVLALVRQRQGLGETLRHRTGELLRGAC